jgi:predicted anti-sigma-YlaC factor YlaD
MINKEHLTPDIMKDLKSGRLSGSEAVTVLEHIGECEQCADAFAGIYRETELLELSPGFRSAVFSAVEREKRPIPIERAKRDNKRRELFRYGFRVSIAACITLVLLFSGTINYGLNLSRSIQPDFSKVNSITEDLKGFSDKLVNFNNIKEE